MSNLNQDLINIKQQLAGVEQQLAEILNLGPTITQKKMWMDKIMELELKVIQKAFEGQMRKQLKQIKEFPDDFEIDWNIKLDQEAKERLKRLK